MAQPNLNSIHADRPLTNMSVAYIQAQSNFVASAVMPTISVGNKSDSYYIFTKNDWFRDEMQQRGSGTESAGSGFNVSTSTFNTTVYALHKDISDQELNNQDMGIDLERATVQFLTQRALVRQEIQFVTDFFTTSVWGTDVVGGTDFTLWSTYASSDPISDVQTGKTTVLGATGLEPNTLVLGYEVFAQLRNHPDIVDRVKYTSSAVVTEQLLARLFDVDRVLVARAVKATNVEGETAVYAFTHGKNALLAHVAPSPGLLTPSAGYTFMWNGVSDGMGETIGISTFPMPELRSQRYEVQRAWDNVAVATDLGYFFSAAVA